ncbi:MAG: hypothetical protein JRC68_00085 [Deltaproteobacteria bacterium]|nr:hypothetical protein [Deltaproteobacteria bacterium]
MGFVKSIADSKGFKGIKPKYLTTEEASGISKRYRLDETAIASFERHSFTTFTGHQGLYYCIAKSLPDITEKK